MDEQTSLNEIETPGNLADSTTVMPTGLGGNDAAAALSAKAHIATMVCGLNMMAAVARTTGKSWSHVYKVKGCLKSSCPPNITGCQ
jgi:hypothetical protein